MTAPAVLCPVTDFGDAAQLVVDMLPGAAFELAWINNDRHGIPPAGPGVICTVYCTDGVRGYSKHQTSAMEAAMTAVDLALAEQRMRAKCAAATATPQGGLL